MAKNDVDTHEKICLCGDIITLAHIWDVGKVTVVPTSDKIGIKTYNCSVCNEMKIEDIRKLPAIVGDSDLQWIQGSTIGLTVISDADFKDFDSVSIDGKEIDKVNYILKSGSTIVTLTPEYLGTLSAEKHTIEIASANGTGRSSFFIKKKSEETVKPIEQETIPKPDTSTKIDLPDTGDSNNLFLCLITLFASASVFVVLIVSKKHRNKLSKYIFINKYFTNSATVP